jgi:hypothetical protein
MNIAIRDIHPEEEILESYTDYDRYMQKYMEGNWNDHAKKWNEVE